MLLPLAECVAALRRSANRDKADLDPLIQGARDPAQHLPRNGLRNFLKPADDPMPWYQ
jgi:hypothetical protein